MRKRRDFISPGIRIDSDPRIPRKIPDGRFLWHNHVQHSVNMPHGFNGFRYWHADLPVNYREFMRCYCGVVDLPHYCIRGRKQKCVSPERVLINGGMTAKQARKAVRDGR